MALANFAVIVLAVCVGPNGQETRKSERRRRKRAFVDAYSEERPFRRPAAIVAIDADADGIFSPLRRLRRGVARRGAGG